MNAYSMTLVVQRNLRRENFDMPVEWSEGTLLTRTALYFRNRVEARRQHRTWATFDCTSRKRGGGGGGKRCLLSAVRDTHSG